MNSPTPGEFRERLLESQSFDPALREHYQRKVQAMWERQLTTSKRILFHAEAVVCGAMAVAFAAAAILAPKVFPPLGRVAFAVGALFSVAFAVAILRIARRGTMDLKRDPMRLTNLSWGVVVIAITLFMLVGGFLPDRDRTIGIQMVVNGIVFLIGAGFALLRTVVEQLQLKTQEKLLEIEYRLAELSEQMKSTQK
jgi:MFS family permease